MTPMTVRKQIEIDAPAERVWPFVATREGGLRWLCNVAEVHELVLEPRVGGRFEERMVVRGREYAHADLRALLFRELLPSLGRLAVLKEVEIEAPPERVWRYVGTQEGLQKWWLPHQIVLEARVGGRYEERSVTGQGTPFRLAGMVITYDPPHRIEMSCREERGAGLAWPADTLISITLSEIFGRTRISVTHSGFEALPDEYREQTIRAHEAGWERSMRRLRALVLPWRPR